MRLRYAYRLNPTPGQRRALAKAFGCARVVFNDAVAARRAAHEAGQAYPTDAELSRALTAAKHTPERSWLAEVSAVVLQQALADANTAYRDFFASRSGKRKGRKLGAPQFRSRKGRAQSIRFTKAARFRVTEAGRLRLPRIGDVAVRWSRELPGATSSVTVTVDASGRYHASFVVEVPDQPLRPTGREVGVDLGLTHFAVLSDGRKVDNPRHGRKAAAKLRRAQKELARRQRGSNNRAKSRRKVARCHARVADTRRDWLHKLSTTTRPPATAAFSARSIVGFRPLACVRRAGPSARRSLCTYGSGSARVGRCTTGTSTPRSTSWPPDGRTDKCLSSRCQTGLRSRNRR